MWQWLTGASPSNNSQNNDRSFWQHYIDDYVADKEGRLSKNREFIEINIRFNLSSIYISKYLRIHNPRQFEALLHHYMSSSSSVFKPVTREDTASYDSKYRDLYREMEVRSASQAGINGKIAALSRYLTVDLKDINVRGINRYNVTYSNLDLSTLPLATQHFQYLMLSLRTWSYPSSSIDGIDEYMRYVMSKYGKESFRIHYVHDPWRPRDLPLQELRIDLTFTLVDKNEKESKHTLEKVLRIRYVDQLKVLLNRYKNYYNYYFQRSTPLQPSSAYGYLHDYTTYRNTLQVRMDKVLSGLRWLLRSFYIKKTNNNSSILGIDYYYLTQSQLPLIIRYLELLTAIFNIWNDDTNDRNEMDRYLREVKEDTYSLVEDRSFGSFYRYYSNEIKWNRWNKWIPTTSNTFKLNLNIILKKHQHNFTNTLHLEGSRSFAYLLDLFNYLPNDYLSFSNSPNKPIVSCKDLLYIFDRYEDEYDPSILNLYYYPLSDELDTSLIVDHLTTMVETFKREVSANPTDNDTLDQYLCCITRELAFLPTPFLSFQYHFITQYNNKLIASSPTNITINLRLLLRDSQSISNTYGLALTNINQLLSLLNHYSLSRDPLDPSWMEGYREHKELYGEISRRGKLQISLDGSLSRLPRDISLDFRKDDSNPYNVEVSYPDLELSSIPYAMKHLELMMLAYRTWNHSSNDKLEVDGFLFQAKEDVEEWYSSSIKDPMDNMLDELHARMDSMLAWSNDWSGSLEDKADGSKVSSRDKGKDDDSRDILPQASTGIGKDASVLGDISALDGRLGGASADFPNLLEIELLEAQEDISMMEDVD